MLTSISNIFHFNIIVLLQCASLAFGRRFVTHLINNQSAFNFVHCKQIVYYFIIFYLSMKIPPTIEESPRPFRTAHRISKQEQSRQRSPLDPELVALMQSFPVKHMYPEKCAELCGEETSPSEQTESDD